MEKNYYDILQINKNASPEIVEKAYKTLVRIYHPDLQENSNKEDYEEKLKLINEAYEILSNEQKRKQYDLELEHLEQIEQIKKQQEYVENSSSNFNYNSNFNVNISNDNPYQETSSYDINEKIEQARIQNEQQRKYEEEYNRQINDAVNKAYHDAYIQDLKNRGYKIEYKKTFKDYIKNFIIFILTIFILILILKIPFVKKYFINLYNENDIIRFIVNIFINLKN